jgi:hypothetical protein
MKLASPFSSLSFHPIEVSLNYSISGWYLLFHQEISNFEPMVLRPLRDKRGILLRCSTRHSEKGGMLRAISKKAVLGRGMCQT